MRYVRCLVAVNTMVLVAWYDVWYQVYVRYQIFWDMGDYNISSRLREFESRATRRRGILLRKKRTTRYCVPSRYHDVHGVDRCLVAG